MLGKSWTKCIRKMHRRLWLSAIRWVARFVCTLHRWNWCRRWSVVWSSMWLRVRPWKRWPACRVSSVLGRRHSKIFSKPSNGVCAADKFEMLIRPRCRCPDKSSSQWSLIYFVYFSRSNIQNCNFWFCFLRRAQYFHRKIGHKWASIDWTSYTYRSSNGHSYSHNINLHRSVDNRRRFGVGHNQFVGNIETASIANRQKVISQANQCQVKPIHLPNFLLFFPHLHRYAWRIDLSKSETYWPGWFENLSQKFLDLRVPKLLLLASIDGLDRTLTVGQMQGKFQLQVLARCGHAVHEDRPHEVAEVIASYMIRNKFAEPAANFARHMPCC